MRCHGYGGCSGHGSGAPRTRRAAFELVARSVGCLPIRSVAVGGAPAALPASPPLPFVPPAAPFPASGWVRFLIPIFNRVIRLTSCPRTARRLQKKTKSCRDTRRVCSVGVRSAKYQIYTWPKPGPYLPEALPDPYLIPRTRQLEQCPKLSAPPKYLKL